ncbi:MAG: hypothetical protein F4X66_06985, partial [Chloroflexi bacterium]|nr:hypothetical protein [Chloroflexota bacterium]
MTPSASFWVRVRPATQGGSVSVPFTVFYHVSSRGNATAEAGDFKEISVTNTGGSLLTVPITDDDKVTKDSRITVTLEPDRGYRLDHDAGIAAFVFIVDDDHPPPGRPNEERADVSVSAKGTVSHGGGVVTLPSVTEGGRVVFTVSARPFLRGGKVRYPLTVHYKLTQTGDFITQTEGHVVISVTSDAEAGCPPLCSNRKTATVAVQTTDDRVSEDDGTVTIEVFPGEGYSTPAGFNRATARVLDDDTPKLRFGADNLALSEERTAQCVTDGGETPDWFVVPHDWPLAPDDLSPGSRFRLLFVTSGARDATSSDINVYNQFVQAAARAGHSALSDSCADRFKVVGSTDTIDANTNTLTRLTDVDAAIYWLGGEKVADHYGDFYDGSWDSRDHRTESAGIRPASEVFTGSQSNGLKSRFSNSRLGDNSPVIGSLMSRFDPLSGFTTLRSISLPFYGLSPVFELGPAPVLYVDPAPHQPLYVRLTTSDGGGGKWDAKAGEDYRASTVDVTIPAGATFVPVDLGDAGITINDDEEADPVDAQNPPTANDDGSYTVPRDWPLKPAGLNPGDEFRLVFVTSTRHTAASSDIAHYDAIVQNAITNNGHADIRAYGSLFKVVGSTSTVDARDHVRMNPGTSSHVDAPVYWLNGKIGASGKSGFWSPHWQNWAFGDYRAETGALPTRFSTPFTGTAVDGQKDPTDHFGSTGSHVRHGSPRSGIGAVSPIYSSLSGHMNDPQALYGISPRFRVGGDEGYESFWLTLEADPAERPAYLVGQDGNSEHLEITIIDDDSPPEARLTPNADGTYTVPASWPLVPRGQGFEQHGGTFRLLFVTTGTRGADSSQIAGYDAFVQASARGEQDGNADEALKPYASLFKVVGATPTVHARDHIGVSDHPDTPVYWLGGPRAVARQSDLFGSSSSHRWENQGKADRRTAASAGYDDRTTRESSVFTGATRDGRGGTVSALGGSGALVHAGAADGHPIQGQLPPRTDDPLPFYAISPVFRVEPAPRL